MPSHGLLHNNNIRKIETEIIDRRYTDLSIGCSVVDDRVTLRVEYVGLAADGRMIVHK